MGQIIYKKKEYCGGGGGGASSWTDLEDKPFNSLSDNFKVTDNILDINGEFGDKVTVSTSLTDGVAIGSIKINDDEAIILKAPDGIKFQTVKSYEDLPATGVTGTIYLVPKNGEEENSYTEYYYILVTSYNYEIYEVWIPTSDNKITITEAQYNSLIDGTGRVFAGDATLSVYGQAVEVSYYLEHYTGYVSTDNLPINVVQYFKGTSEVRNRSSAINKSDCVKKENIKGHYEILGKVSDWSDLANKPFNSLSSEDFEVNNNVLSIKNKGTDVSYTPAVESGIKLGTLSIDGSDTEIYAPDVTSVKFSTTGHTNDAIRFGITEDGQYGYYKVGADTVTPFKTGGGEDYTELINSINEKTHIEDTNIISAVNHLLAISPWSKSLSDTFGTLTFKQKKFNLVGTLSDNVSVELEDVEEATE